MKNGLEKLYEYRYEVNQVAKLTILDLLHYRVHIYGIKLLPIYYIIMLIRLNKVMIKYRKLEINGVFKSVSLEQRVQFIVGLVAYIVVTSIMSLLVVFWILTLFYFIGG